jgi:3-hydroxyisobutyrate dehydrogenase-like beta-hydroxyacid dehydrogenase
MVEHDERAGGVASPSAADASIRVGFVGLGSQGLPMARRIVDAGHPTTLWARRPQSLAPFSGSAASCAATPAELGAASDVLCVCVVDDRDVEQVLAGPEGAMRAMAPGSVVVIHSTVHPRTCRRLQEAHPELRVVDAPVSGGAGRADEGTLLVMVGGESAAIARCRPVLATFGDPIVVVGELGAAQEAKLLNNTLFTAQLGLVAEAFELAGARGLDSEAVGTILANGSAQSYAADVVAAFGCSLDRLAEMTASLLTKDVSIFTTLTGARDTPMTSAAASALRRMGGDDSDSR